ncbi:DsbA family oxidoreductase [Vibrio sp. SCSIO 43136]|uniref:DsbA family oxidoreductase n=1 Tax=Vibrio sp. SCSIO 43136 TaxID=2819101 RepID=UPI002075ABF3|nr:DsbA family oxidoreductase [Vibrio sp. SCSIO 43136]USD64727.1 DsbA family oxidoreductase [Vibrio sp. SCSIO 43136]
MAKPIVELDFIADVTCPWCYVSYLNLARAIEVLDDKLDITLTWQPFELSVDLPESGVPLPLFLDKRYGLTPEQITAQFEQLSQLALSANGEINFDSSSMIYNTRKAHILLLWAIESGLQHALKVALFEAYFSHGENIEDHDVLKRCCKKVGLPGDDVESVLSSEEWNKKVEDQELQWLSLGVHAVPALVVNQQHLISGSQTKEIFIEALQDLVFA